MWVQEHRQDSTADADRLFEILTDTARWPEWNAGVSRIERDGPFETGTTATMVMPDGTVLRFRLTWVAPGHGFTDETEIPDVGVVVRVRHELSRHQAGTTILYRCEVDGPEQVAAEVGAAVCADFPDVLAALATRAQRTP